MEQGSTGWSTALDVMDGIHSARARQTVVDMRAALSALRRSGVPATVELDARASWQARSLRSSPSHT
ncbi:MAG: hypothetical protein ACRDUW_06930 [Pseudonocardiaceae bacterium]